MATCGSLLTRRERDVLRLAANGYTQPMIAEKLGISRQTVHNHVRRILQCIDARNMPHAVYLVYVERRGLPERKGAA